MKAIAVKFGVIAMALVVAVAFAGTGFADDAAKKTEPAKTEAKKADTTKKADATKKASTTKKSDTKKTAKAPAKGAKGGGDQDAIKKVLDEAMKALQAADIDAMIKDYADDFKSDQGGGKPEFKEFLNGAKEQGFLKDIKIDQSKLVIAVDGTKATAKPVALEGAFGALTVEFTLEKRADKWLVTYQAQY